MYENIPYTRRKAMALVLVVKSVPTALQCILVLFLKRVPSMTMVTLYVTLVNIGLNRRMSTGGSSQSYGYCKS